MPCRSRDRCPITSDVNLSHPFFACEAGAWALTVRTALSSSTPCAAQCSRDPCAGVAQAQSSLSSLNMLRSDEGTFLPCAAHEELCAEN